MNNGLKRFGQNLYKIRKLLMGTGLAGATMVAVLYGFSEDQPRPLAQPPVGAPWLDARSPGDAGERLLAKLTRPPWSPRWECRNCLPPADVPDEVEVPPTLIPEEPLLQDVQPITPELFIPPVLEVPPLPRVVPWVPPVRVHERRTRFISPMVPEPATWAFMLIGFAMAAAAMRRSGARTPGSAGSD